MASNYNKDFAKTPGAIWYRTAVSAALIGAVFSIISRVTVFASPMLKPPMA